MTKPTQSLFGADDVKPEVPVKKGSQYFQLSPSSLSLYNDCKRCFWLQLKHKIYKPRGIFPSLPGGMDGVIKVYFDKFRNTKPGLPPELIGEVAGKLYTDQARLNGWRSRTGGLFYIDKKQNAKLLGLLDDCLQDGEVCIPLDYKTRGYPPKDDTSGYYQHQLDIYEFLLQQNGFKTKGLGYLVYYHPVEVREDGVVQFEITPKAMKSDPKRAKKLFDDALKLLQSDTAPKPGDRCEFCPWGKRQGGYE